MESAVANLCVPGDPALVASAGKFGERWAELCDAHGADLTHLEFEWGEKLDPARVDEALAALAEAGRAPCSRPSRRPRPGSCNDVRALAEVARGHDAILVVDAISGLGAVNLPQDEWGVDVVVSGSQKSLMSPPGLAFASVSERALAAAAESPGRRYYFDWARTAEGQREQPANSPFTPAVTLWRALDVALGLIAGRAWPGLREARAPRPRSARRDRGDGPRALRPRGPRRQRRDRGPPAGVDRRRRDPEADARPARDHRSPAARDT